MNRDQFWAIIAHGQHESEPAAPVRAALQSLSPAELESFQRHFDELFDEAYRWDLWGAAYALEGGCSDDGFTDFRYALISRGRIVYEAALKHPDSLAGAEVYGDELFGSIASEVYEAKTRAEIPRGPGKARPAGPAGETWDFDDVKEVRRRLPKIAARKKLA